MSYRNLSNFSSILNRTDFDYISSLRKIEHLSKIILFDLSTIPDSTAKVFASFFEDYLSNLDSFCNWVGSQGDVQYGHRVVDGELRRIVALLNEPISKRMDISNRYRSKFNKFFLMGLNKIEQGLRAAFDPDIVSHTNISTGQIVNFFLDKTIGLGRMFQFNDSGNFSFVNVLHTLDSAELALTERLLLRPNPAQIRTYFGWQDRGIGDTRVRVLMKPGRVPIVGFLYRNNDKGKAAYGRQISEFRRNPNSVKLHLV